MSQGEALSRNSLLITWSELDYRESLTKNLLKHRTRAESAQENSPESKLLQRGHQSLTGKGQDLIKARGGKRGRYQMLFGNTQNINNSKYEIFIICSCEGLFGNILLLFLCPQCFFWEGRKSGILQKDVNQEWEKNWAGGVNSCTSGLSFILQLIPSEPWILLRLKIQHTQIWKRWDYPHSK